MSGNNLHLLEAPNYQLDKCSRKRTELLESFSIAFIWALTLRIFIHWVKNMRYLTKHNEGGER